MDRKAQGRCRRARHAPGQTRSRQRAKMSRSGAALAQAGRLRHEGGMPEPPALLGVESSLTGLRWTGPDDTTRRAAELLAQKTGLPPALCTVLASRGVSEHDAAGHLRPQLRALLPDPRRLRDMEKAAARLVAALRAREPIAIFADYDVDGGASAALLLSWLRAMDHDATLYVPDRVAEGYGPNAPAMQALAREHRLIVCVDCGTAAAEAIAAARPADVVILDHHIATDRLPAAHALVNPNRADEDGSLSHLCAAAVVFLALVEANRQLRISGTTGPDLLSLLDLVALATVADVAPLTGVNRAFVRQGLTVMAGRARPGLAALADVAGLSGPPSAHALGYVLGPRINAGGRIGQADLGARLLCATRLDEAEALARALHALNDERRALTEAIGTEALAQAEARGTDGPLVWAAGEGWHPGIVGIVASRLKEATGRAAVAIGLEGGIGKGSARAGPGVNLGAAVQQLVGEGLLLAGGGHRAAAGLTLRAEDLAPAMERLGALIARQGAVAEAPSLRLDGVLMAEASLAGVAHAIEDAGPFGAGAPAPRFALAGVALRASRMGAGHLRLRLPAAAAGVEAVAFRAFDSALGPALEGLGARTCHLAGRLAVETWRGRARVRFIVEDAALTS